MLTPPLSPKLPINQYIPKKRCLNFCYILIMPGLLMFILGVWHILSSQNVLTEEITYTSEGAHNLKKDNTLVLIKGDIGSGLKWNWQALGAAKQELIECKRNIILLVLITSSPENYIKRLGIRKTSCSKKQIEAIGGVTYNWQCVFLIGRTHDAAVTRSVRKERQTFRDILLGDYTDSYRNLTLKVLHGFKWGLKECQANYFLKTDDDCFINTPILSQFLLYENIVTTGLYAGHVFLDENHRQVVRGDPTQNKWAVSNEDFKEQYYPEYASGTGYVLSRDVVMDILDLVHLVPPFVNEDAYIGTLVHKIGITPVRSGRFTLQNKWGTCNFLYLFIIHRVGIETHREMLDQVAKARKVCHSGEEEKSWR